MAQITIYLPDELEDKARKAAKSAGKSVSGWIADQVVRHLDDTWPKGVIDAAGAFPSFPEADELRRGYGQESGREPME